MSDETPHKAIWALFSLLPMHEEFLMLTNKDIEPYRSVSNYLKRGERLKKHISISDLKALLYDVKGMSIRTDTGEEYVNSDKLDLVLGQFGMRCSFRTVKIKNNKRYWTVIVNDRGSGALACSTRRTRSEGMMPTGWDYESLCRGHIRKTKSQYQDSLYKARCNKRKREELNLRLTSYRNQHISAEKKIESRDDPIEKDISLGQTDEFSFPHLEEHRDQSFDLTQQPKSSVSVENSNGLILNSHSPYYDTEEALEAIIEEQQMENESAQDDQPPQPVIPQLVIHAEPQQQPVVNFNNNDQIGWAINQIVEAESFDFNAVQRINPYTNQPITISDRKLLNFQEKMFITNLALSWGYSDPTKEQNIRQRILNAAKRRVYFLNGLSEPGHSNRVIEDAIRQIRKAEVSGDQTLLPIENKTRNRKSKVQKITEAHPQLLHQVFRYACNTIGRTAPILDLVAMMNSKLANTGHNDIILKKHNFTEFFKANNGVMKAEKFVPRLTEDKKMKRVAWCQWCIEQLALYGNALPMCWLDEKWFYMTSGRSKVKHLPCAAFENEEETRTPNPCVRSRRHPTKSMFAAVGTFPHETGSGKISLHRVSRNRQRLKRSHDTKFVDSGELNSLIRDGDWRNLYSPELDHDGNSLTVGEFLDLVGNFFDMDDDIIDSLCLTYSTKARVHMKKMELSRENDNEPLIGDRMIKEMNGTLRSLTIDDFELSVLHEEGDFVEEDCSCDSAFMTRIMPIIGAEIRTYYSWLEDTDTIYLVIDNAGGHGTATCVSNYKQMLKDEYNIELIHQVPNSPETNILDLGVWRALQSRVERLSYRNRQDKDVLAKTVKTAWQEFSPDVMTKVYRKWKRVVQHLIPLDDGGNRYVEEFRGKLTNDPNATQDDEDEAFAEYIEQIKAEKAARAAQQAAEN